MSNADSVAAAPPSPDIATKAELDHLTENRPEPMPEPHLTPDSAMTGAVNQQVNEANESRLCDLQQRLKVMRDGAERDFGLAQVNDRAKASFERSR